MRKDYNKINGLAFEDLTEDEIDELYRPRQANSNKSLLPLYIYLILQSAPKGKHLKQKEIAKILENRFEVHAEKKAISRALHTMDDANIGVISTSDTGNWLESA